MVAYSLTAYRQGWMDCQVKGRVVRFCDRNEQDSVQSLIHKALHRYHEENYLDAKAIEGIVRRYSPENTMALLQSAIKHKDLERIIFNIPEDVLQHFKEIVLASSPPYTISPETKFNEYTLADYHKVWVQLSALMLAYIRACNIRYKPQSQLLINSRIIIVEPTELASLLGGMIKDISADSVTEIVRGLILDVNSNRPDFQVQSLVPSGIDNLLLLSPELIYTSNWEVCLLRHWAKIFPGKYGSIVASQKDKLADRLAVLFNQTGVNTAIRKIIEDSCGKPLVDVDLAVLDELNGYLAFIEVKWLIEPDSFQEESNAQQEIHKGIAQLRIIEKMLDLDKNGLILKIFNDKQIKPECVTDIHYFLISQGEVHSRVNSDRIDILDYQLSYRMLEKNILLPLKNRFAEIIEYHNNLKVKTSNDMVYNCTKLGGYLFQTLGLSMKGPIREKKPSSPKEPCSCGSGKSYGSCCQILEDYEEKDVSFNSKL